MNQQASREVCTAFAKWWSALPPSERQPFYEEILVFMRFYTETTVEYRNLLHAELVSASV
jgi:hypothetical protein